MGRERTGMAFMFSRIAYPTISAPVLPVQTAFMMDAVGPKGLLL